MSFFFCGHAFLNPDWLYEEMALVLVHDWWFCVRKKRSFVFPGSKGHLSFVRGVYYVCVLAGEARPSFLSFLYFDNS